MTIVRARGTSLAKSTEAKNGLMSPAARAVPWARSRHHAALVMTAVPSVGAWKGSSRRKATLKKAAGAEAVPAPPG